ncbi:hypothetical protein [Brevibacillus massiliensis]|uniref:hypothetical protein n=1 Tax=Brevibacillus massiliensis TaxID=1118054 RepID=UPI001FE02BB4|nr:hypothetical protein [Brevibacillus massiliensis]
MPKPALPTEEPHGHLEDAVKEIRSVYFEEGGGYVETTVYDRSKIPVGSVFHGPAIVEQLDSTVVVPPGFTAEVDAYKNILLTY